MRLESKLTMKTTIKLKQKEASIQLKKDNKNYRRSCSKISNRSQQTLKKFKI
jgi:hypothetical protein